LRRSLFGEFLKARIIPQIFAVKAGPEKFEWDSLQATID
jgi:hypothetical protein